MTFKEINLKEINEDFFFRFTRGRAPDPLRQSIAKRGIRTPLPVLESKGGYQIITGFKRYETACLLEMSSIPVYVESGNAEPLEIFTDTLLEHRLERGDAPFSLLEKAHIARILEKSRPVSRSTESALLSVAELPDTSDILREMRSFIELPHPVKEYIEKFGLSHKQALVFQMLSGDDSSRIASIGLKENIRAVELSEIIRMLRDIQQRNGVISGQIEDIETIFRSDLHKRNQKILAVKDVLNESWAPYRTGILRKLEKMKQRLQLPRGIDITWDRTLERAGLLISGQIWTEEDLNRFSMTFTDKKLQDLVIEMLREI